MRELRFHREIYRAEAVDEAVQVFDRFADFEVSNDGEHRVVVLTAKKASREKRIADELANYALGLTIRGRGVP